MQNPEGPHKNINFVMSLNTKIQHMIWLNNQTKAKYSLKMLYFWLTLLNGRTRTATLTQSVLWTSDTLALMVQQAGVCLGTQHNRRLPHKVPRLDCVELHGNSSTLVTECLGDAHFFFLGPDFDKIKHLRVKLNTLQFNNDNESPNWRQAGWNSSPRPVWTPSNLMGGKIRSHSFEAKSL